MAKFTRGCGDVHTNSKVQDSTWNRMNLVSPSDNGTLCPHLDFRMIEIGYGIEQDELAKFLAGGCAAPEPKLYIQEMINMFAEPNSLEEQYFTETFSYKREISTTSAVGVTPVTDTYSKTIFTSIMNYLEHLEEHFEKDKVGCEIDKERREEKDTKIGTSSPDLPVHMFNHFERYALCRACEHEESNGTKEKVECDYRDWKAFGDNDEDLFPICRRYEYYAGNTEPTDTHQRVFALNGDKMGWYDNPPSPISAAREEAEAFNNLFGEGDDE